MKLQSFQHCLGFLVFGLLTAPPAPAQDLTRELAPLGRLIVTNLASAPFPHPQRAQGHVYQGQTYSAPAHYSDNTVLLFLPARFRCTDPVDLVVHFHGWRNTAAGALKQFKLAEQLAASGRNAVLVIPQGPRNAPDSFGGKLEDAGGFARFLTEVLACLPADAGARGSPPAPGRIILSGHSGGYQVISAILERGGLSDKIQEVWLFDGLYARTDRFLAWLDAHPAARFVTLYTDNGGTLEETKTMMNRLETRRQSYYQNKDTAATAEDLLKHRRLFLHTNLGHNEVLDKREAFRLLLSTSGLRPESSSTD